MTARIIVVDNSATSRITLKVRLGAACYDVVTAASIRELGCQLRDANPDLVLLASGLDRHSLVDLCRMISESRPELAILALTETGQRPQALRAGAAAVLPPCVDDQMMRARIRGLLRDADVGAELVMARPAGTFDRGRTAGVNRVVLVADNAGRALRWRHRLQAQLAHCHFAICNPEETLGAAATGQGADLYMIAADIDGRGDGLRLLSELRSRAGSRDAAFIVATHPDRDELAAIALDLGAGEVLPIDLGGAVDPELAAWAVCSQLQRKHDADRRRAEAQRHMVWAMTDPLTGLHNRRYALPRLSEIAGDATRHGQPFAVLILDLDRFKAINDGHGHTAGDAVLSEVARRISDAVADRGITARLGGEEFLVVLPRCDEATAWQAAETIRKTVGSWPIALPQLAGGGAIHVTLSAGVAVVTRPMSQMRPEFLAELSLERADRALIAAKSMGRNRVMLAQDERAA